MSLQFPPFTPSPVPPRPPVFKPTGVELAQVHLKDAQAATERGLKAHRPEQLEDAIQSTRRFLSLAEKALQGLATK